MAKPNKAKPKRAIKPKPPAEAKGTPVCIAALFCDSVFTDENQMLTIIRTIDTINFSPGTQFELGQAVELANPTRLVLMLKRNDATGRHELPVRITGPSGETDIIGMIVVDFSRDAGPDLGYNHIGPVRFIWRGEGLYWIEVKSKNKLIAKTSLRLNIVPG